MDDQEMPVGSRNVAEITSLVKKGISEGFYASDPEYKNRCKTVLPESFRDLHLFTVGIDSKPVDYPIPEGTIVIEQTIDSDWGDQKSHKLLTWLIEPTGGVRQVENRMAHADNPSVKDRKVENPLNPKETEVVTDAILTGLRPRNS